MSNPYNPAKPAPEKKLHYSLVATEVMVIEGDTMGSIKLNVMLALETNHITAKDLGLVQRLAQQNFWQRRGGVSNDITIADVFIVGISYLGLMREKTFHNLPKAEELEAEALPVAGLQ